MQKKITPGFLFLYLAFGLLCLAACDKSEDDGTPDPDNPAQTACQLTKVAEEGDDEYGEVEYNTQGYATKLLSKESGSNAVDEYTLLTYNTNNQLVKWEDYEAGQLDDDYSTLEYTNSLLTTVNNYDGSIISSVTTLKYNTDKRLIEYSIDEREEIVFKSTYAYDSKGNVTNEENFYNDVLTSATTYENYDDKHTPYAAVKGVPGILFDDLSQNNPGKKTYAYDSNGDGVLQPGESSEVTTYAYEYNSDGFPTEITETEDDGDTEIIMFTYACQ